jgi:hypothetical protein
MAGLVRDPTHPDYLDIPESPASESMLAGVALEDLKTSVESFVEWLGQIHYSLGRGVDVEVEEKEPPDRYDRAVEVTIKYPGHRDTQITFYLLDEGENRTSVFLVASLTFALQTWLYRAAIDGIKTIFEAVSIDAKARPSKRGAPYRVSRRGRNEIVNRWRILKAQGMQKTEFVRAPIAIEGEIVQISAKTLTRWEKEFPVFYPD